MSSEFNDRFILLPSINTKAMQGLHYKDLLTYITIRSYNNSTTDWCIPSLDTISERAGMNKKTIIKSIKRLERAGYLEVKRTIKRRESNEYKFARVNVFCQIPYSLFDVDELNSSQKAMLLCLRQCFDNINLECMPGSLSNMAIMLGLTYKTVYTQYKILLERGYINELATIRKSGKTKKIIQLSEKLNWKYERKIHKDKESTDDLKFG